MPSTSSAVKPVVLQTSVASHTYILFTLAMAATFVGVFFGMIYVSTLLQTSMLVTLSIVELALIFTARFWVEKYPLNYVLFLAFPLLSGITITPYILLVLTGFSNGPAILFNASLATVFMALAAAVFARIGPNLAGFARTMFICIVGLLVVLVLQMLIPALRTQLPEMLISAAAILLFAVFTAMDLQRISQFGRQSQSPFLLALSLYLDIFNIFIYILRFMTALSGERR